MDLKFNIDKKENYKLNSTSKKTVGPSKLKLCGFFESEGERE